MVAVGTRDCAVCGSSEKRLLFRQRFAGDLEGALFSGYEVVVCTRCGFGFADGLPNQSAFDAYYARMSKYEFAHHGGEQEAAAERRYEATAAFVRPLVTDPRTRVLDIGCSTGGLLDAFRTAGYRQVLGLDPSPACARAADSRYGIAVLQGSLLKPPDTIGRHDLILLSAVLEHVRDLRAALAETHALLEAGGYLYAEVPDATRFGEARDAPFQEFSVEHVNYFSPRSLRNLLDTAGFSAVALESAALDLAPGTVGYAVRGLFRKTDRVESRFEIDDETGPALDAYIEASGTIEAGLRAAIDPWVGNGRPIVVWGVGTHTQRLLATSDLKKARIVAYVDSNQNYQGALFGGVPVISPDAVRARTEPILISSRFYQEEIARQVRDELGLSNELIRLYRL